MLKKFWLLNLDTKPLTCILFEITSLIWKYLDKVLLQSILPPIAFT